MSGTYLTIVETLKNEIASLPAGTKLPAEVALADRFKVARETLRRALAVLEADGLISTQHGRGRFVGAGPAALPANLASIAADLDRRT